MNEPPVRAIDSVRNQAEQLGLRIVELSATRWMVTRNGQAVYRASSLRDLQLFLAMQTEP